MARLLSLVVGGLVCATMPHSLGAVPATTTPACFDIAVVATDGTYWALPAAFSADAGDIIVRAPHLIEFEVEQSVIGTDPGDSLTVAQSYHTRPWGPRDHLLLFLRRAKRGSYRVVDELDVVADSGGDFAFPMTEPLDGQPEWPTALPPDYKRWLRPIHYDRDDARLLLFDNLTDADAARIRARPWVRIARDRFVATRGLPVVAIARFMAPRICRTKGGSGS